MANRVWTDEECRILQNKYKECGSQILELLEKYTVAAIRQKAHKLGLTGSIAPPLMFKGKPSHMCDILKYYNLTADVVINARKAGLTHQNFVNRL